MQLQHGHSIGGFPPTPVKKQNKNMKILLSKLDQIAFFVAGLYV